jgi:hypothetical protein
MWLNEVGQKNKESQRDDLRCLPAVSAASPLSLYLFLFQIGYSLTGRLRSKEK